ncbi:hypothetical protein D030_4526B, partial [Vibrio parahaemolyticus AQ3810]
SWHKVE